MAVRALSLTKYPNLVAIKISSTNSLNNVYKDDVSLIIQTFSEQIMSEEATETQIFRRSGWEDKELLKFPTNPDTGEDIETIQELLLYAMKKFSGNKGMGTRHKNEDGTYGKHYDFNTYHDCEVAVAAFGFGLRLLGLQPKERVGIYSVNRPEWDYADFACSFLNYISIPLYESIATNAIEFIINHGGVCCVVCSNDKLKKLEAVWDRCPTLKYVILMDPLTDDLREIVNKKKNESELKIFTFEEISDMGRPHVKDGMENLPKYTSEDIYTIMYTSGTTGDPKGVPLTHGNILSSFVGAVECGIRCTADDSYYSFLPLGHILERQVHLVGLYFGARVGFFTGDIRNVLDEIQILGPSIFIGVPRVYNKIFNGIHHKLSDMAWHRRLLFRISSHMQKNHLEKGERGRLWDYLVFDKTREGIGGNVRFMISGSAPLAAEVQEFMELCFQCPIISGYGMTEAYPVTLPSFNDREADNVGEVMPHMEMKLVSIPEMEYTVQDKPYARGEILVRGPAVFKGYYNMPELTAELFDDDGFFHTGDIGEILPGNRLHLIDRRKNIFKLSQGEYVAAEKLEALYSGLCVQVEQVFVYGNSYENCLVAIVVPFMEELVHVFPDAKNEEKGLNTPNIKEFVMKEFKVIHEQTHLHGFERICDIYFSSEQFSIENGLLTPTLKLKRHNITKKYDPELKAMYEKMKS